MLEIDYDKIWLPNKNIDGVKEYILEPPFSQPPFITLKVYSMGDPSKPLDLQTRTNMYIFISSEIDEETFSRESGIAFAIFSPDYFNLNVWKKNDNGILFLPNVWYSDDNFVTAQKIDITKEGPYCIYELDLVQAESKLWRRIPDLELTHKEKIDWYLNTIPEGLKIKKR